VSIANARPLHLGRIGSGVMACPFAACSGKGATKWAFSPRLIPRVYHQLECRVE
jgi:hypothetical protein